MKSFNPYLNMPNPERFLTRLILSVSQIILFILSLSLITTDLPRLKYLGLLLLIIFLDYLFHLKISPLKLPLNSKVPLKNIYFYLTPKANRLLENSLNESISRQNNFPATLLLNLSNTSLIKNLCLRLEIDPLALNSIINNHLKNSPNQKDLDLILKNALSSAKLNNDPSINESHLFVGLFYLENETINKIKNTFSLDVSDLFRAVRLLNLSRQLKSLSHLPLTLSNLPYYASTTPKVINRAWTSRQTPILNKYSIDLTTAANHESLGLLIGHSKEYALLEDALSQTNKPNAILIGLPGSGKNTLLAHLAYNLTRDLVPKPLFDQRLVSLKIDRLIMDTSANEATKLLHLILDEINAAKNIILYIENFDQLLKTSPSFPLTNILLPAIRGNAFSCIATTTPTAYKKITQEQTSILDTFTPINIEPISLDEAMTVLTLTSLITENQYHNQHHITIPAIKKATLYADRYMADIPLPESANRLLRLAFTHAEENNEALINASLITTITEEQIHIPLHASKAAKQQLLDLESLIHRQLIDQTEAVTAVASSLRQYHSGLSFGHKPIASFLFVGPTGVGKTELSKIIAQLEFNDSHSLIRLDMSEYKNEDGLNRLLSAGSSDLSERFVDQVSKKPYSLILLDEFEKAHPDIHNLFLQVLDEGRLTTLSGRLLNFQNSIIIATSNAHSTYITRALDNQTPFDAITKEIKDKLADYFKPELINRFSKIIIFKPLSREDMFKIARLKIDFLLKEFANSKGISINYNENVITNISQLGFSPSFGARPLDEAISDHLKDPLAKKILKDEVSQGDELYLSYERDELQIKKSNP